MKILSNFHNPGAESVPGKVTRQQCCLQTAAEPRLRCAPLLAPCLKAAPRRADAPFLSQASIPGTAITPVLECVLPRRGTERANAATAFAPARRHAITEPITAHRGWHPQVTGGVSSAPVHSTAAAGSTRISHEVQEITKAGPLAAPAHHRERSLQTTGSIPYLSLRYNGLRQYCLLLETASSTSQPRFFYTVNWRT